MNPELPIIVDEHIRLAIREDMASGDVSTDSVLPARKSARVSLICKQEGIVAGLQVFARVFELLDPSVRVTFHVDDGDTVSSGQVLGYVEGDAGALLSGERTALNYLQRMSGIATYTRHMADLIEGTGIELVDTRKTTPCMRYFEKWAVRIGGGKNHRFSLSDGVMLKDNHIAAAGGVSQAVEAARARAGFLCRIEVEVENLAMVQEALDAGADVIMLDNMTYDQMGEAISLIDGRAETECSGNITADTVGSVINLGVDYISSGALTHSAGILDMSMKGFTLIDSFEDD